MILLMGIWISFTKKPMNPCDAQKRLIRTRARDLEVRTHHNAKANGRRSSRLDELCHRTNPLNCEGRGKVDVLH